jgi:hypothetical protein
MSDSGYSGQSGYSGSAIIYGTGPAPSPTGYPEGTVYVQYGNDLPSQSGYSGFSGDSIIGESGASGYSGTSTLGESGASGYSGTSTSGSSGYSGLGVSGYSGYSGVSTSGQSGYSGESGYSGYSGRSGYSGQSGYSGYSGIGLSGYSGENGQAASSGYSGTNGQSGYSGKSGYSGMSGSSGQSGYSGKINYFNVLDYGAVPLQLRSNCHGSSGSFTNNTTLQQTGQFVDVVNGDILWILNGASLNIYTISTHTNDSVTISGTFPSFGYSGVYWKVTTAASTVDNRAAFQAAISAANTAGGGVVYVPTGYFYFTSTSTILISQNVILQGMRPGPAFWRKDYWLVGQAQGPVLLPTATSGASFITLQGIDGTSIIEGLTVFYPFQLLSGTTGGNSFSVVSYPWCIEFQAGLTNQNAQFCDNRAMNLTLVNPYNGIKMEGANYANTIGTTRNHVYNIYGCPLNIGISINNIEDVSYIEKINFSSYNMVPYDPTVSGAQWVDWNTYIVQHVTAIQIKRADWLILEDIFALFAHCGILLTDDAITSGATLMGDNIQFDLADVGIHINLVNLSNSFTEPIFTNVRITSGSPYVNNPVTAYQTLHCIYGDATANLGTSTVKITNASLLNFLGGNCVQWDIPGSLTISDALFFEDALVGTSLGYAVAATNGNIHIHGCEFGASQFLNCFNITSAGTSVIYGNEYNNNITGINDSLNSNLAITGTADNAETNYRTSQTYSQLTLRDSDTQTAGLRLGYMFNFGVNEYGRIQAFDSVGPTPLALNPNGGNIGIATGSNPIQGQFQIGNSFIVAPAPTGVAATDTANIISSIAAVTRNTNIGATVYLQSGLYMINATILLNNSLNLIGSATGTTVLYANNVTPFEVVKIFQSSFATIKNLRIDSVQSHIHTGISDKQSYFTTVENCEIWNMDIGLFLTFDLHNFSNNDFNNCNTAILLGDASDATNGWCSANNFSSCHISYCKVYGIHLAYAAFNNRFFGVTIEANWGPSMVAGIYFGDSDGGDKANLLDGCYFENNDGSQIKIATKGNIFVGNTILYPSAPMISAAVPTTIGLTGLTVDGTSVYTGTSSCPVSVKCVSGTQFQWSNDNEVTWSASITITGSSQLLFNGVKIIFSSTTGHAITEKWTFWAYYTEQGISFDDINSTGTGNSFYGNYEASTTGGVVYRDMQMRPVSIGLTTTIDSHAQLQVTGGDIKVATLAKGVILTNAAGTLTKRVRLNDTGDGLIFENP